MISSDKLGLPPLKGEVAFHHVSDEMPEGSAVEEPSWNFSMYRHKRLNYILWQGEKILEFDNNYINNDLKECYKELGSFISGDRVVLSKLNIAIKPEVYQLKEKMATVGYHIYSPEWKNELFEISSALGSDQKTAVGMAQGGFMFGIMETVQAMMNDVNAREFDSDFNGLHKWKLYIGNVVAFGKEVPVDDVKIYWDIIKDEIAKRIGNQDICCIKIYAANSGEEGFSTGECRINNNKIDSLSEVIEGIAKSWKNKNFASHKQFFILKQEKETLKDYPYSNADIYDAVEKSLMLYERVMNDGKEDLYFNVLKEFLGDTSLAQDIYNFIPEIFAEFAIENVRFSEKIQFNLHGSVRTFYKSQLATYYPIFNAAASILDRNVLKNTEKVFQELLTTSASLNAVNNALDSGSKMENLILTDMLFNVTDDYIVR